MSPDVAAGLGFLRSRQGAIVVANDPPRWTILAVNDAYLAVTHKTRNGLMGQPLFEAFPQSHETDAEGGTHNVEESLIKAVRGEFDLLPVQRYDIRPEDGSDGFIERYWQLSSSPLRDEAGKSSRSFTKSRTSQRSASRRRNARCSSLNSRHAMRH